MRITVLGAGRVGNAIVRDLAGEFAVTAVDSSAAALARLAATAGVTTVAADIGDPAEVARVVADADLVVGAVPGFMGFATLAAVIAAGKDVVDISFFPEDAFRLDGEARARGVRAVVDCGIAPGCSNLFAGRLGASWERLDRFACYVGGLPVVRRWPWEYKAPFSPLDVVEEYTRPARLVAGGVVITVPALTDLELVDIPGVGTLEAFNTDGLRSLLRTMSVPSMVEKTMRYPGHAEKVLLLRESGLLSEGEIECGGARVRPRDVAAAALAAAWHLEEGEEDVTVMKVAAEGVCDGVAVRFSADLVDRYDRATKVTSMARTTGYTCTAAVRAIARGLWREPGIAPPELLGRDAACHDFILADLARHNVVFRRSEGPVTERNPHGSLP
jgi:saccharopine dehydrogenase-like NADP-dependent oxidoreductase